MVPVLCRPPSTAAKHRLSIWVPAEPRVGLPMKVVCLDGTIVECDRFRAIDEGVLLFDDQSTGDDEEDEEATGFIPRESLRFVLPDDVDYRTSTGMGQGQPQQQYESTPQQQVHQPPDRPPQQQPHPR